MKFPHDVIYKRYGTKGLELFDKYGFMLAFSSGTFLILTCKLLDLSQIFTTAAAVSVMLIYAGLIRFSVRLQLREDQAGDNLYYLGLLFTLVSLAWALYIFDPGLGAKQIISSFGIALATTITGLFLRVLFSQMRQSPIEIEHVARIELAEAANSVRMSLGDIVREIKHFHTSIQQATAETHSHASGVISDMGAATATAVSEVTANFKKFTEDMNRGLETTTKDLEKSIGLVTSAISNHSSTISEANDRSSSLGVQLEKLTRLASEAERGLAALSKNATEVKQTKESLVQLTAAIQEMTALQRGALLEVRDSINTFCETAKTASNDWESQTSKSLTRILENAESLQTTITSRLESLYQSQFTSLNELSDTVRVQSESIKQHNMKLASELAKSREYTTALQQTLTAMSKGLLEYLDDRRASTSRQV